MSTCLSTVCLQISGVLQAIATIAAASGAPVLWPNIRQLLAGATAAATVVVADVYALFRFCILHKWLLQCCSQSISWGTLQQVGRQYVCCVNRMQQVPLIMCCLAVLLLPPFPVPLPARLTPYLSPLSTSQLKLLTIYFNRTQGKQQQQQQLGAS